MNAFNVKRATVVAAIPVLLLFLAGMPGASDAATVDLTTWFPHRLFNWVDSSSSTPTWVLSADKTSVVQQVNGAPSAFLSGVESLGRAFEGDFQVASSTTDDDFIGFILGYDGGSPSNLVASGDATTNGGTYIVVDWKRANQDYEGATAVAGMRAKLLTTLRTFSPTSSISDASHLWSSTDRTNTEATMKLLQVASTGTGGKGATGWVRGVTYRIKFNYTPTRLQVWVDGVLQIDVTAPEGTTFPGGSFGFYNFSQDKVTYSGFVEADATEDGSDPFACPCVGATEVCSSSGSMSLTRTSPGQTVKICFDQSTTCPK